MAPANPPKSMYAVRLDFQGYIEFANWMTDTNRYKTAPGPLSNQIAVKLQSLSAQVYDDCSGPQRPFNAGTDHVVAHADHAHNLNVSLPVEICRDANGDIDYDYLISYVQDIKAASDADGARALLGMYFLSRCR